MHLHWQDLIDFCKEIGLQSSAAATRNATIKLIGTLHKFVGPGDLSASETSKCFENLAEAKMDFPFVQISKDSCQM